MCRRSADVHSGLHSRMMIRLFYINCFRDHERKLTVFIKLSIAPESFFAFEITWNIEHKVVQQTLKTGCDKNLLHSRAKSEKHKTSCETYRSTGIKASML